MADEKPHTQDVDLSIVRALRRWENEGGHLAPASPGQPRELAAAENNILRCLGAAVVLAWNELPMPVQRALFRHATAVNESYDPARVKTAIARFLHLHKDDENDSSR